MADEFTVTFHGVRGSHPVSGEPFLRTGGNTTCVEVRAGGRIIIIDAGTGIIGLGRQLAQEFAERTPKIFTLLFTHTHYDHTMGFSFFQPAFIPDAEIFIYGPGTFQQDLREILSAAMVPPVFPVSLDEMPASKRIESIREVNEIAFLGEDERPVLRRPQQPIDEPAAPTVRIRVAKGYAHPQLGVFIYRIEYAGKAFVFATDTEGYVGTDRRLIRLASGADLLVHDAQYTPEEYTSDSAPRQGWGHSTWQMACSVAAEAGAKRLLLTHHDPARDDDGVDEIERASGAECAREGMRVAL